MAKAKSRVSTINQVVKAYCGPEQFTRAFNLPGDGLESWVRAGVPRAHHLGLYLGLLRRRHSPSPKLFGLTE